MKRTASHPAGCARRIARHSAVAAAALMVATGPALAQSIPTMDIDSTAPQAVKLVVLLVVFVVVLLSMRSVRLPEIVRTSLFWLIAIVALVGLYAYRVPLQSVGREVAAVLVPGVTVQDGESVVVRRSFGGHFEIEGTVDGAPVRFLFDTGASTVVLSAEDAARAGFDPDALDYRVPVVTAGGMTEVAPVRLPDIAIGGIRMESVRAAVARPGELDRSLLGMSFLNRLSGYDVRRDRLVLIP